MLSHGWRCYPTDVNIYDLYSRGIIGVIVHGQVINIYNYTKYMITAFENKRNPHRYIQNTCTTLSFLSC